MPSTNVVVKFNSSNPWMNEVLPVGFKTVIKPLSSPSGNFSSYRFKGANGNTYTDWDIRNAIGYRSLAQVFDKVN